MKRHGSLFRIFSSGQDKFVTALAVLFTCAFPLVGQVTFELIYIAHVCTYRCSLQVYTHRPVTEKSPQPPPPKKKNENKRRKSRTACHRAVFSLQVVRQSNIRYYLDFYTQKINKQKKNSRICIVSTRRRIKYM